jgi:hypothetical protein
MRNKIFFSIAFSLILVTLACSDDSLGGGSSIDPNANPAIYANNSSSSNGEGTKKGGGSELIVFNTGITQTIRIVNDDESVIGVIEVYADENGAALSCENEGKGYSNKFRIDNNRIEKSMALRKYGTACDSVFEIFKSSCRLKIENDWLSGSCNEEGKLTANCVYSDESANFDSFLSDFIKESKEFCNGSLSN